MWYEMVHKGMLCCKEANGVAQTEKKRLFALCKVILKAYTDHRYRAPYLTSFKMAFQIPISLITSLNRSYSTSTEKLTAKSPSWCLMPKSLHPQLTGPSTDSFSVLSFAELAFYLSPFAFVYTPDFVCPSYL